MASLLIMVCLALLAVTAAGTEFKVGGTGVWAPLTDSNSMSYNQWAERQRFQIGDSLLFVYPAQQDSVLQVDKEAYESCNTTIYIRKSNNGNTVFKLDRSGAFFFISGVEPNCLRNESMHVVVLADRSSSGSGATPPSSPPSPSPPSSTPPPAPEASSPPPPPPKASSPPTGSTTPPAPTGSDENTPSTAPAAEESTPPPNGASIMAMGFTASIGALLGSFLLL